MTNERIELVRKALKRYREISGAFRYGGLWQDWQRAKEALEALDEIEEERKPQQVALPGMD